jgi:hypothetical protein
MTFTPFLILTVGFEDGTLRQGFQPMSDFHWIEGEDSPRPRAESLARLRQTLAATPHDPEMTRSIYALNYDDLRALDLHFDWTDQDAVQRIVSQIIAKGEPISLTLENLEN